MVSFLFWKNKKPYPKLVVLSVYCYLSTYEPNIEEHSNKTVITDMDETTHYELTRRWTFVGFAGHYDSECKPQNLREMIIDFRADNKVTGRSSCNAFGGDYSVSENNTISMHHLVYKTMYCGDNTIKYWEEKYFNALKNAVSYEIRGNRLIINTYSGVKMIFNISAANDIVNFSL